MHLGVFFLLFHELLLSVVLVPGVRADPPPLQQSCADWCNRQYTPNSPGGWIDGTSVFCGGTPNNCPGSLSLLANSSFFGDYGNRCVTGNKYCCCGKSANVAKTSQFFCCSEGNVACGENINDNNCCPEGMNMNMNSSGCTCKGKSSTGMCASINPKSKSQPKPSPSPATAKIPPANVPYPAPANVPSNELSPESSQQRNGSGEVSDLTPRPNGEQTDWPLLVVWGIFGLFSAAVIGYIALRFVLPCCLKCLKRFDCCDICDVVDFMNLGAETE